MSDYGSFIQAQSDEERDRLAAKILLGNGISYDPEIGPVRDWALGRILQLLMKTDTDLRGITYGELLEKIAKSAWTNEGDLRTTFRDVAKDKA